MAKQGTVKEQIIEIDPIQTSEIECCLVGMSPLIVHRFSWKSRMELLYPSNKKREERKAELKHDPLHEYQSSLYMNRDSDRPTLFHLPEGMFRKTIAAAALDMPRTKKAEIGRWVNVPKAQIDLYGEPRLLMSMVRPNNQAPDVRTRAIFERWACIVPVRFLETRINRESIANLFAAAGTVTGIGEWRNQKGGGSFGQFRITNKDDKEFLDITKHFGRKVQTAAFQNPTCYDEDTEELYLWFQNEVKKRSDKSKIKSDDAIASKKGNGKSHLERKVRSIDDRHA